MDDDEPGDNLMPSVLFSYLLAGAGVLVGVTALLSIISGSMQRQRITYRGKVGGKGDLLIYGQGEEPATEAAEEARSVAAMGAQLSARIEPTNFALQGAPDPVVQEMTTYLLGDDLYDESYRVTDSEGFPQGELGIAVAEAIALDDAKNVLAFELWLFDINDATTTSKIMVTDTAYRRQAVHQRLAPKGKLVSVDAGHWVEIKSGSLQARARIVDMAIKDDARVAGLIFERLTIELAAWRSADGALPALPESASATAAPTPSSSADKLGPGQQRVVTSYLVRYPERPTVRHPQILQISIPGTGPRKARRQTEAQANSAPADKTPGELSFIQYQPGTESKAAPEMPVIGIGLHFDPEALQVPITNTTVELSSSRPQIVEFSFTPKKPGDVRVTVNFHHLGKEYVPESMEMIEVMDKATGEMKTVERAVAPERYTQAIKLLAAEAVSIQARRGTGFLRLLTLIVGLGLIGAYVFWGLTLAPIKLFEEAYMMAGGVLLSLAILLLLPRLIRRS